MRETSGYKQKTVSSAHSQLYKMPHRWIHRRPLQCPQSCQWLCGCEELTVLESLSPAERLRRILFTALLGITSPSLLSEWQETTPPWPSAEI
ncbi:hypothetical protein AOLI_G00072230 [Acnodon oligacanthus]